MQHVLITGANRGIGLELAKQYIEHGDMVYAGARDPQKTAALEDIAEQHPQHLNILPFDVADEQSIENSRKIVEKSTSRLDILINNAASHVSGESITTFQATEATMLLRVNAIGPVLVCKEFLALLRESPEPKIINISSEAGSISKMNRFRGYSYYASKAALNMFTRALAHDPELKGSIVVAIHPGWVKTDLGGPDARLLPAESAKSIVKVVAGLEPENTGSFFTWEGDNYPW